MNRPLFLGARLPCDQVMISNLPGGNRLSWDSWSIIRMLSPTYPTAVIGCMTKSERGLVALTLPDACKVEGGCTQFVEVSGTVYFDRTGGSKLNATDVFVLASDAAYCSRWVPTGSLGNKLLTTTDLTILVGSDDEVDMGRRQGGPLRLEKVGAIGAGHQECTQPIAVEPVFAGLPVCDPGAGDRSAIGSGENSPAHRNARTDIAPLLGHGFVVGARGPVPRGHTVCRR